MIRIILCDDDPVFLNELNRQVPEHLDCSGKVHCFTAMEQIPDSILSGCDITLLDADFEDGMIRTTKQLPREHGAEYSFDYQDGWFRFAAELPEVQHSQYLYDYI